MGAARLVLRDWSIGKLPRYAVPPAPQDATTATDCGDSALAAIYTNDAALLERLVTRKELRRSRDVVRLSSGRADERALALEAPWFGSARDDDDMEAEGRQASDSESDDSVGAESAESDSQAQQASVGEEEDDSEDGGGGNASDGAQDIRHVNTDGNEEEDEAPLPGTGIARTSSSAASTRKRKLPLPPSLPSDVDPTRPNQKKRVAFAVSPAADKKKKKQKSTLDLAASSKINYAKTRLRSSSSTPARASAAAQGGTAKPAANAPTAAHKRKNQVATTAGGSEDGAYDFSKFF